MLPPPCQGGIASSTLGLAVERADAGRARTPCGRRTRRSRSRAPARRPRMCETACAPSTSTRAPWRCAIATISRAGVMVPSAFETCVNATEPRARAEQLLVLLEDDLAAIVDRRDAQPRALLGGRAAATGTMLAWCSSQVMTISSPARDVAPAPALRDQVDALGRAAHEDDLLRRRRVEEARAPSRARPRRRRSRARRACAPRGGCSSSRARRSTTRRSMTACGFCVVAALSSQTSGRPCTRSLQDREVALDRAASNRSATVAARIGELGSRCGRGARRAPPVRRASRAEARRFERSTAWSPSVVPCRPGERAQRKPGRDGIGAGQRERPQVVVAKWRRPRRCGRGRWRHARHGRRGERRERRDRRVVAVRGGASAEGLRERRGVGDVAGRPRRSLGLGGGAATTGEMRWGATGTGRRRQRRRRATRARRQRARPVRAEARQAARRAQRRDASARRRSSPAGARAVVSSAGVPRARRITCTHGTCRPRRSRARRARRR